MEKKIVLNKIPVVLCIISFMSTFSNSYAYLFVTNRQIPVALNYLYFVFVLIAAFYYSVISNRTGKILTFNYRIKYIIPLFIWVVFKSVLSSRLGDNSISLSLLSNFLTMFVITISIKNRSDFKLGLMSLALGALPSAIIPLISRPDLIGQRIIQVGTEEYIGGYWNGPMITFISIGWLLIAFVQSKDIKKINKQIIIITVILTFSAGFAGLSRALLLATVLAIFSVVILSREFKRKTQIIIISFLAVLAVYIYMPETVSNLLDRVIKTSSAVSEEARIYIWSSYLENYKEFFFLGAIQNYRLLGPKTFIAGPHSVVLNWLVQFGILGLLGFIYLLFGILREIKKVMKFKYIEGTFLIAWLVSYLGLALLGETGFFELSFYVGFGYALNWSRTMTDNNRISD